MRGTDRLGLAVMAGMALALTPLTTISADRWLFVGCLLVIAAVGLVGVLGRRLATPGRAWGDLLVAATQAGAALATVTALAAMDGIGNPFAPEVFAAAGRWVIESSAPMQPQAQVRVVTMLLVAVVTVIADQLSVTFDQPAWSLMPIGMPYLMVALAVPALAPFEPVAWVIAGYVLVLLAEASNQARTLGLAGPSGARLLGGLVCVLVAVPAAALAGVLTPGLDPGAEAPFTGRGPVQMGDPSLDLRRNLQQPIDRRVLTYTTSRDRGEYLRLTSLPAFDATGFHLTPIDLFSGNLPAPPGVAPGRPTFQVQVRVEDFGSEWLPLPYAPGSLDATGLWRHDPVSLSVLAAGENRTRATNGLVYDVVAVDVDPTPDQILRARAGMPAGAADTAELPADLPARVRELARQVTEGASTDGERALAIQDWLRSDAFSYSLEPAPGSGYDALTRFLFDDRSGYCEQFAGSMAVLARAVGIPSRVSVGFLPGSRSGDDWEVSLHDMHAWPELYFADLGWVRFEPTPGIAQAPGYADRSETPATASPSAIPTPTPSASAEEEPETEEPDGEELPAEPGEQALPAWSTLWWAAAGGVLAVLLGAPAAVRWVRHRRRSAAMGLAGRDPRAAVRAGWDEIRDSVWDAGGEWPDGSARQIGDRVADGLPDEAAQAMRRVALEVERARYAQALGDVDPALADDVRRVGSGLVDGGRPWWRAVWPRSVWRRLRR